MAELVAFVPDAHEADLREVLTAYLEEGAARLEQAVGVEQDIPRRRRRRHGSIVAIRPDRGTIVAGG